MRVGFLTYGMRDHLTGIGRYTQELSYALRRVAPEIDITLINPYPDSPLDWYTHFPTYPVPSLRRLPSVMTYGSAVLDRAARSLDLDVLHDPCGIAPFLVPRSRVARVVTIHDAIPRLFPAGQMPLTRVVFNTLLPLARWSADAVVTDSQSARTDLVRLLHLPDALLTVVPCGVNVPPADQQAVIHESLPQCLHALGLHGRYFLYVGAVNPRKNIATLVEAARRVRLRYPDVQLAVAGPAGWKIAESMAAMRAQPDLVQQCGFVDDAALEILYAGATAFVFPSLYEGFGLPPLEAMARGTPVIASNTSSLPEVVGDAGLLIDPHDTAALADAMLAVLERPELAANLRHRGFQRASAFTWDAAALALLDVYTGVTSALRVDPAYSPHQMVQAAELARDPHSARATGDPRQGT